MFRALSLATAFAATGATGDVLADPAEDLVNACEDDALSFLQLRADHHHQRATVQEHTHEEWGHEVIERPLVDHNKCDGWELVGTQWNRIFKVCPFQVRDDALTPARNGVAAQVVTGVRFYAKQAGNFGLRFEIYRHGGNLAQQSEPIDVPVAGVIQEYTFKKPLFLMNEDWVGFIHDGHGNIGYSEGSESNQPVIWRGCLGTEENWPGKIQIPEETAHGTCSVFAVCPTTLNRQLVPQTSAKRTYSYSLIVRTATKADLPETMCLDRQPKPLAPPQELLDSLPDAAPEPLLPDPDEGDGAAAVGDPHLTTNDGTHFDIQ